MSTNTVETVSGDYELRESARLLRMDLYDDKKQGIFSDISTVETPEGNTLITISKHLERINGNKDRVNELSIRAVDADNANSVFDLAVKGKVEDVIFPLKDSIPFYGPLTDVESDNMRFLITENARNLIEDRGADIGLMGEELSEVQSIQVNDTQEDLAKATDKIRHDILSIKRQMGSCKAKILATKPEWAGLAYEKFIIKLATEGNFPDCKKYLQLDARLSKNKRLIDQYSAIIMAESVGKVFVPDHISADDLRLPSFDIVEERFISERVPVTSLEKIIGMDVNDIPNITELPTIEIGDINL